MNANEDVYIYQRAKMEVRPEWGGDFYKFELIPGDYEKYESEPWTCPRCNTQGSFSYWWSGDRMVGDPGAKVLFYLRYVPVYQCPNCGNQQASLSALKDIETQADEILGQLRIAKE
jgi:hypothetical protein